VAAFRLDPRRDADLIRRLGLGGEKKKGRDRYGAHKTADGFDSGWERTCWLELRSLAGGGLVRSFTRQPVCHLMVDGEEIGDYTGDFAVELEPEGEKVVLDAKSPETARARDFRRTIRHVRAQYGVEVIPVVMGRDTVLSALQRHLARGKK
jgi:hypothetical protein